MPLGAAANGGTDCPALFPLPVQMPPGDIERYGPAVVRAGSRPGRHEPFVLESAARAALPGVLSWLGGGSATGTRGILKDLMRAARHDDAWQAARELGERRHWDGVDGALVELLDGLIDNVRWAHEELVAVWVRTFSVTPSMAVGDAAACRTSVGGRTVRVAGEIIAIDAAQARYHLRCPSLGHVAAGPGTHAFVLDYEQVEAAD